MAASLLVHDIQAEDHGAEVTPNKFLASGRNLSYPAKQEFREQLP
jgi:hypothetical protein